MRDAASYFEYLDGRFESVPGDRTELTLSLAGRLIRIVFAGMTPPDVMLCNLRLLLVSNRDGSADETVFVFRDNLSSLMEESMIPQENRSRKTGPGSITGPGHTGFCFPV